MMENLGWDKLKAFIHDKFEYLKTAHPTAVNLSQAGEKFERRISELSGTAAAEARVVLIKEMEKMLTEDIDANKAIGRNGAMHIASILHESAKATVLIH